MEKQPKVDLIIPIYNAEVWIPSLLATLENQQMRDFRVIFVDDGSKDDSYRVLQEQLQTVRFPYLLLQQENQGPSAARNTGMAHAQADWIAFMDCDDELKPEFLEYLYRGAQSADCQMGFCQLEMIPRDSGKKPCAAEPFTAAAMTPEAAMESHYTSWIAPVCLILNRQWVAQQGLVFDTACRYCEDLMFITKCIAAAQTVVQIPVSLYVYWTHEGSLLRSSDTSKYQNGMEGFARLEQALAREDSPAAKAFFAMGRSRFLLGIVRRAAIQLSPKDFMDLARQAKLEECRGQFGQLPLKQKIAAYIYLTSKRLFYYVVRVAFKD